MARRLTTICCSAGALIAMFAATSRAQTSTTTPSPARTVKQTHAGDDKTPLSLFPVTPIWTLDLENPLTAAPAFREKIAVFALESEQIAAYDLETGARLWISNVTTTVQPAIGMNVVYVRTDESLIALSLRTGETLWTQPFDDELAVPPVAAGDLVVLSTLDGDVIALRSSDGTEVWRRRLTAAASSAPAVSATRLFVPTADSTVAAVDITNGAVVWSRRLGGIGHDILAGDDRIFLGAQDRYFYCLDVKNGEVAWRWATGADAIGRPVVDERTVYFVSLDNVLRALNRSSGVQRWKSPLPIRPVAGPLKYRETLIVAGTAPTLQAYSLRDGKAQGRPYTVTTELSAPPQLLDTGARVFPVLVTISSDIVGRATVTGATRDIEPATQSLTPLPNIEKIPVMPEGPVELGVVSALPNLTPVAAAAPR